MFRRTTLNSLYITIGGAIIAALMAALIGPFLIDWTAYRANFEQYAERLLGHKVQVLGTADASILPTPTLTFTDVRVGPKDDPLMTVEQFAVRIELAPLLRGDVQVLDMQLIKPKLKLALDKQGRLDWLMGFGPSKAVLAIKPDAVALQNVEIQDGAVEVSDARTGELHSFSSVNLLVGASSLLGPFKLEGGVVKEDAPFSIKVATGRRLDDGSLRIKAQILPANQPITIAVDGRLANKDGLPDYRGTFALSRIFGEELPEEEVELAAEVGNEPWKAEGEFQATSGGLKLEKLEIRHGPEDKPYGLSGVATMEFGIKPSFNAIFKAKQINLDRTIGSGPSQPADMQMAFAELVSWLSAVPVPTMDGRIQLDIPGIVVGGGLIQKLHFEAVPGADGWTVKALEATLPGQTWISARGNLTPGEDLKFDGFVNLDSRQPAAFASWWRRGDEIKPVRVDPFVIDGRLVADRNGFKLNELSAKSGSARIAGSLEWKPPTEDSNAEFGAVLKAESLDVDQVIAIARLLAPTGGRPADAPTDGLPDINIEVEAEHVKIRGVDARKVDIKAGLAGDTLTVDTLEIAELAGARINAGGKVSSIFTAPDGNLSASIKAGNPDVLIALLSEFWPESVIIKQLAGAPQSLGPVDLAATFGARGMGDETSAEFTVKGEAGGSVVDFKGSFSGTPQHWRDGEVTVIAKLDNSNGIKLMRQLGLTALPLDDALLGGLSVNANGRFADGLTVRAGGRFEGLAVKLSGNLALPAGTPANFDMDLTLNSDDFSRIALVTGRVLPVLSGRVPIEISAAIIGQGLRFEANEIRGSLAGTSISGQMTVDVERDIPHIVGALDLGYADFRFLTELILGADAWSGSAGEGGGRWPDTTFGAPIIAGVSTDIAFRTETLQMDNERALRRAAFNLRMRPNELAIEKLSGEAAGGTVAGYLRLKRSAGEAVANGGIKMTGIAIEDFAWTRNRRAVASGLADISLNFEGTGRSISSIIGGLSGSGAFSVYNGQFRYINPQAFNSVIRAIDAGLELKDEAIRKAFVGHLDSGVLNFGSGSGVIALAGGTLRARNVSLSGDSATIFVSATVDLEQQKLKSDWTMKIDPGENRITGAEPQVGLVFEGSIAKPRRRIDVAPLTAFLTLRAFELEVRRIEIMQADILERERFVRQLRQLKRRRTNRRKAALQRKQLREEAKRAAVEKEKRNAEAEVARLKAEREEKARQARVAEEEAKRKAAEAKVSKKTEEELARKKRVEELARRRAAVEAARKKDAELAAKRRAEEAERLKAAQELAAKKRIEAERAVDAAVAKKAAEAEAARKAAAKVDKEAGDDKADAARSAFTAKVKSRLDAKSSDTASGDGSDTKSDDVARKVDGKLPPLEPGVDIDTGKTDDDKPADDTKPSDTKPSDTKPGDTKPGDTKPGDTKPGDTKTGDTGSDDATSDPETAAPKPGDDTVKKQPARRRTSRGAPLDLSTPSTGRRTTAGRRNPVTQTRRAQTGTQAPVKMDR